MRYRQHNKAHRGRHYHHQHRHQHSATNTCTCPCQPTRRCHRTRPHTTPAQAAVSERAEVCGVSGWRWSCGHLGLMGVDRAQKCQCRQREHLHPDGGYKGGTRRLSAQEWYHYLPALSPVTSFEQSGDNFKQRTASVGERSSMNVMRAMSRDSACSD